MTPLKKDDIFPFGKYAGQQKTVFSVIVKDAKFVDALVKSGAIVLSAESRETLAKFLVNPLTSNSRTSHNDSETTWLSGRVIRHTPKAVLFEKGTNRKWLPRQFVEMDDHTETGDVFIEVPLWLAHQNGFR